MPAKTFESHGEATLSGAMLQPVDSIMNSMRARVRPIARPLLSASGRSYRSNYIQPAVMFDELSVYLLRQNYGIRRKSSRRDRACPVPARPAVAREPPGRATTRVAPYIRALVRAPNPPRPQAI